MWKHTASIHKQHCIQLLKSWWLPLIHLSNFSPTTPFTWLQWAKVFQKVGNTIHWIILSLWARYSGCSGGGLGKGGRACNTSLEFEYLHRKSRCKMLIGRDDISNDVIPHGTCFSMFVYIHPHFRFMLIDGNLTAQLTGSHRGIVGGIQIPET